MKKHYSSRHSLCIKDPIDHKGVPAHTPPIYATSTFVYSDLDKVTDFFKGKGEADVYSRWSNPTNVVVEEKIAALETFGMEEEGAAVLFGSGMAAISALLMGLGLKSGDTVVAQGNIYGTTVELLNSTLTDLGVNTVYTDLHDLEALEDLLKKDKRIKLIYFETPANPLCTCYALKSIAALSNMYKVKTAVDNTFASPILQQPLSLGIDYVVHSATKYLNGHGTGLSGVVVSLDKDFIKDRIWKMRKLLGGICSPFESFLLNNGIKTLALRMERHCDNTFLVSQFLKQQKEVLIVHYPGSPDHPDHIMASSQMHDFGGMLSFELKGGLKAGMNLMRKVEFCTLTASLGTVDTLIQHPASMSHINVPQEQREAFNITDGLIRLSVGLEAPEDIISDLEQGLIQ